MISFMCTHLKSPELSSMTLNPNSPDKVWTRVVFPELRGPETTATGFRVPSASEEKSDSSLDVTADSNRYRDRRRDLVERPVFLESVALRFRFLLSNRRSQTFKCSIVVTFPKKSHGDRGAKSFVHGRSFASGSERAKYLKKSLQPFVKLRHKGSCCYDV